MAKAKALPGLTLIRVPRAYAEGCSLNANSLDHGVNDFERKACPVLDAPAVCICPMIAHILGELVDEIAVCSVDLDPVKPSFVDGIGRRRSVKCWILLNF